ncbi:MAG: ribosomal-processing cysteine protease Prp [Xylanivirga thermophila]|jgi:uncharacterized protein|uniref:ribosomal-processing cysteine protease Prp n=1 Tax=Xylanivirga thermophila TaxID=2496273 RepID=UPI00101BC1D0|nr:ribosomal-processing cysteine protease Prp [Xylanivirga thermophila]
MINVKILRDVQGSVQGFELVGHAGYAQAGQDIVCAAVSAIVQTAVMGLSDVLNIDIDYMQHKGNVVCSISENIDLQKRKYADIILETMIVGLKSIQLEYNKYISIKEMEVE